jgi:hypothetical protein
MCLARGAAESVETLAKLRTTRDTLNSILTENEQLRIQVSCVLHFTSRQYLIYAKAQKVEFRLSTSFCFSRSLSRIVDFAWLFIRIHMDTYALELLVRNLDTDLDPGDTILLYFWKEVNFNTSLKLLKTSSKTSRNIFKNFQNHLQKLLKTA